MQPLELINLALQGLKITQHALCGVKPSSGSDQRASDSQHNSEKKAVKSESYVFFQLFCVSENKRPSDVLKRKKNYFFDASKVWRAATFLILCFIRAVQLMTRTKRLSCLSLSKQPKHIKSILLNMNFHSVFFFLFLSCCNRQINNSLPLPPKQSFSSMSYFPVSFI